MMSIGRALGELANRAPERPLVSDSSETLSRIELERRSNRLARALLELGVKQDDFAAIALPNSVELIVAEFAAWKAGATPLFLSYALPRRERQAILELAKPTVAFGVDPEEHPGVCGLPIGYRPPQALSDAALEQDRIARYRRALTSGGSTGRPKIIVFPVPAVADPDSEIFPMARAAGVELPPEPTLLVCGPLYHTAHISFANMALQTGAHVAIMDRFDAEKTLQWIDEQQACFTVLVPTMMHRIWRLGEEVRSRYDLSSLAAIMHTAAPCPPWLKRAWIEWLGPRRIFEIYGSTEGLLTTMINGEEWLDHPGSVGRVHPKAVRILDPEGNDVAPGEVGEIYVRQRRGPAPYLYIGAEMKGRGEWKTLGDMGRLDAASYLYLADRKTDMIISGGANVFPAEVEAAIEAHPAVRSSAVIGLPHEDLGRRVHAIVDIAGGELDADSLRAFLADRLVRYKIPRTFEWVRQPLRNDAGKVRRSALLRARTTSVAMRSIRPHQGSVPPPA